MIKKLIEKIINTEISAWQWVTGFVGILFIRYILENISSQNHLGIITADAATLIHYCLFYFGVIISFTLILKIFLPIKIQEITKLTLFILPIIWLPPLFDLLITWGVGWDMSYHFAYAPQLFIDWLAFFGDFTSGITPGIRLEIFLLLTGSALLIYAYTKNFFKSIIGIITLYTGLFLWLSAPSILYLIGDLFRLQTADIYNFLPSLVNGSVLNNNLFMPDTAIADITRLKEIQFNRALIQIYTIIIVIIMAAWSYLKNKYDLIAIIKNSRPRRLLFYFSFIIIGLVIAAKNQLYSWSGNFLDLTTFVCAGLSYYGAWMFSVGVNDIADRPIDRITNQIRPLITKEISVRRMQDYNIFFLILAVVSAYAVSPYMLFFILVFMAAYFIYSSHPLQIKRLPVISTFLIALVALSVTLSAFFMVSHDKTISAFPTDIILIIIATVTLFANVKDIKDYQGDKKNSINTLPAKLGLKKSKVIIGYMTLLSFLVMPLISARWWLLIPALICGLIAYWLINKQNYQEKYLFYLYFFFVIIILL